MSLSRDMSEIKAGLLEDSGIVLARKRDSLCFGSSPAKRPPDVKSKRYSTGRIPTTKARSLLGKGNSRITFPSQHYDYDWDLSYFYQCFNVMDLIGEGSFGTVHKVVSKDNHSVYAIKQSKQLMYMGSLSRKRAVKEIHIQNSLSGHPNIVNLYQAWEEKGIIYLQLEFCEKSLADIALVDHDIGDDTIRKVLHDITSALEYMHDQGYLHLDVKLANILVGVDGTYKLGDFGLVTNVDDDVKNIDEGDSKYLAPEVLNGHFTAAADIFSLGISMLELACDVVLPGNGEDWQALRKNQIPYSLTTRLSPKMILIIISMMEKDYKLRPTANRVLSMLEESAKEVEAEQLKEEQSITDEQTYYRWMYNYLERLLALRNFIQPFEIWERFRNFLIPRQQEIQNGLENASSIPEVKPTRSLKRRLADTFPDECNKTV